MDPKLLVCDSCEKPTWHTYTRTLRYLQGDYLIWTCTCKRERVYGCDDVIEVCVVPELYMVADNGSNDQTVV